MRERMKRRISVCGMGMSMSAPHARPDQSGQIAGEAVGKIHEPKPPAGGIAFPRPHVRRKARQAHTFLEARGGAQVRFAGMATR